MQVRLLHEENTCAPPVIGGRSPIESNHFVQLPDIWTTMAMAGIKLTSVEMSPFLAGDPQPSIAQVPANRSRKRKHFKRTLFTDAQRQTLMNWLRAHQSNPYPTTAEKEALMNETGLHRDQINIWFTNNRIRQGITSGHHYADQKSSGRVASFGSSRKA
jgi:hypothetical protein